MWIINTIRTLFNRRRYRLRLNVFVIGTKPRNVYDINYLSIDTNEIATIKVHSHCVTVPLWIGDGKSFTLSPSNDRSSVVISPNPNGGVGRLVVIASIHNKPVQKTIVINVNPVSTKAVKLIINYGNPSPRTL